MNCIILESRDPFFNRAIEEILLKKRKEDYLILGINSPSVIIGKHQSAHKEVNTRFVDENKIPVIRRFSGGGTVYHDEGNMNFTFITKSEEGKQIDFRRYTKPVIDFLHTLGVTARFEGKNDLKVDGLKISGNAEHVHRNRVMHHGTLLFDTSLDMLRNSLRKDQGAYLTRGVNSNPSSVTNLRTLLPAYTNIESLRTGMMDYFLLTMDGSHLYSLSDAETDEAEALANSKYSSWEWNYAYGPEYTFKRSIEVNKQYVNISMHVKDGIIDSCETDGTDFFYHIAGKMVGKRHMVADLKDLFRNENLKFGDIDVYSFF